MCIRDRYINGASTIERGCEIKETASRFRQNQPQIVINKKSSIEIIILRFPKKNKVTYLRSTYLHFQLSPETDDIYQKNDNNQ